MGANEDLVSGVPPCTEEMPMEELVGVPFLLLEEELPWMVFNMGVEKDLHLSRIAL